MEGKPLSEDRHVFDDDVLINVIVLEPVPVTRFQQLLRLYARLGINGTSSQSSCHHAAQKLNHSVRAVVILNLLEAGRANL
jgi:hypothetical protein